MTGGEKETDRESLVKRSCPDLVIKGVISLHKKKKEEDRD